MSNDKHTPGRWHYSDPQAPHYDFNPICSEGSQEYIATAVFTGNAEETAANARLIAAAPDLLAALKSINVLTSPAMRTFDEMCNDSGMACDIARAAIARAEGRQS